MKGNKKVIDYLNRALKHELTASSQYWLHYRLLDDWGYGKMAKKWREESIEEMEHADNLIVRIIFLEGHPNLQELNPLKIGQSVREILDADLAAEYDARALYKKARDVCKDEGDYVSKELFEKPSAPMCKYPSTVHSCRRRCWISRHDGAVLRSAFQRAQNLTWPPQIAGA